MKASQSDDEADEISSGENASLYIANLDYSIEESDLVGFLSRWSTPENVYMPVDRISGRRRGFAFAEFETEEVADSIRPQIDGQEFKGRSVVVRKARPRS